ncbi:acyltransferase family protein [Parafilimonas sp.]|uniref:acyltransferase family protein n=1 Tax=Parafilimonas sp. TaxID=1969739 RepID=UPI003F8137CA
MNTDGGLSHKLHGLDHLRAFAITYVFLYHYGRFFPHPEWTNTLTRFGWSGVDLFFVLSGYLIAAQLFKSIATYKTISLRDFFIKRFFRIIPIYLVTVALYFLFPFVRERESPAPLWKYLTFTQNINLDIAKQGTFSHSWSLCIEEQFYLLLPFILLGLMKLKLFKKAYWLLAVLFISGLAVRIVLHSNLESDNDWLTWYKWIYFPTWSRLDGLLVGVSIAALLQFRPALSKKILAHEKILLLTGVIIFAVSHYICSNQISFSSSVFGLPLTDIGYGLIVLSALSPQSFLYKFESKITSKIATLSYGIYLIHKMAVHVAQPQLIKLDIKAESNFMFILCAVIVFMIALLLNEIIEKPFLKLRSRLLSKKFI